MALAQRLDVKERVDMFVVDKLERWDLLCLGQYFQLLWALSSLHPRRMILQKMQLALNLPAILR